VVNVDRQLRADERDIGLIGQHDRQRLVAALRRRHGDIEPDLVKVALGNRHIGRSEQDGARDFVVANLYTWLRLRKGRQRGGDREQRRKTSLERAAAVEHGRSPSREDNSFDPTKKILSQKTKIHSKKFRDVSGPRVFLGWPARTRRVRTRRRKQ